MSATTSSPLLPIPSSRSYLLKLTSAFIFLLLLGLGSAEKEQMSIPTDTLSSSDSYGISLNKYYLVPDHALRNVNYTYQSKQGGTSSSSEKFNMTIDNTMYYNNSWFNFVHYAYLRTGVSVGGYTAVLFNNVTDSYYLYNTTKAGILSPLSCSTYEEEKAAYDGSYSTGFFWYLGNPRDISACGDNDKYYSQLYESTLFYDVGDNGFYDVLFLVLDEYGRPVEDATVTPKRILDNHTYSSVDTDIVGNARFSLNDGYEYLLSVSKEGYNNLSGIINIYSTSYTLTLNTLSEGGIIFYGINNNVSLITSPAQNPTPLLSNFSFSATDTLSRLYSVSVYAYLNDTLYNNTCYVDGYIDNKTFSAPLNNYLYGETVFSADTGQNITTNNFFLNDGTREGGVSLTTGKYDLGASFDGVNDYIGMGANWDFSKKTTMCSWNKITSSSESAFSVGSFNEMAIDIINQKFRILTYDGVNYEGTLTNNEFNYNEWYYICGVYNGTSVMIYQNGLLQTDISSELIDNGPQKLRIGTRELGYWFNGLIDEVRIWNRTLNQTEIQAEMNSPLPLIGEDLLLSYSFEDYNTTHVRDSHYLVGRTDDEGELISPAYNFDGDTSYLELSEEIIGDYPFTISSWFYTPYTYSGSEQIFQKRDGSNTNYVYVNRVADELLRIGLQDADGHNCYSQTSYSKEKYNFFTGKYNGTHLLIYINGELKDYDVCTNVDLWKINGNFRIGINSYNYVNNAFNGILSNVQIFNRSLTETEIQHLYSVCVGDNSSCGTSLSLDLSLFAGSTVDTYYQYSLLSNGTLNSYVLNMPWLVVDINQSDTSAAGVMEDFEGLGLFAKTLLFTVLIIIVVMVLSLLGIPPEWAASVSIPLFIIAIFFSWVDPIVGGLVSLVLIGLTIIASRSGVGL